MKRLGAPGAPRATPPQHDDAPHATQYSQYQHLQHIPSQHMQQGQHVGQQQMQQPTQVSMHPLTQTTQPLIGGSSMLSVGSSATSQATNNVQTQFVRASVRPPQSSTPVSALGSLSTSQVINYSKGGAAYNSPAKPPIRHKPLGSQSPGGVGSVQVSVGGPTNNHGGLGPSLGPSLGSNLGPGIMGGPPLSAAGAAQFQRLKVEDALSYLDQVKYKFNNQPQVYNDFLDIMKEFKSQSIDTPGVIARVSNLFKGHPELIVGFNTFLPPGYKIEVQANGQEGPTLAAFHLLSVNAAHQTLMENHSDYVIQVFIASANVGVAYQVSVSMPSPTSCGTNTTHSLQHAPNVLPLQGGQGGLPPSSSVSGVSQQQLVHILPVPVASPQQVSNVVMGGNSNSNGGSGSVGGGVVQNLSGSVAANTLHHISQAHQQIEAAAAAAAQQHHGPGVPHVLHAAVTQQVAPSTGQPVEFNHAIEYVNKIKSRFSRQPDKYKRFLEILHAYQRGQREVKEASVKQQTEQEVYAQVAKLFENQDDLLAEFGQFLPDATGAAKQALLRPLQGLAHNQGLQVVPQIAPAQRNLEGLHAASLEQLQHVAPEPHVGAGGPAVSVGGGAGIPGGYRERPPSPSTVRDREHTQLASLKHSTSTVNISGAHHHLKRSPSFTSNTNQIGSIVGPPAKKLRPTLGTGVSSAIVAPSGATGAGGVGGVGPRDVSYAEAAKYGTLADFGFFDHVRKALRSQEVYENFLRCLLLFTNEVISKSELLQVTAPFLSRHADLQRWLNEFLGPPASPPPGPQPHTAPASPPSWSAHEAPGLGYGSSSYSSTNPQASADIPPREASLLEGRSRERYESLGTTGAQLRLERPQGDLAMDVDLNTCKRLGTSYCALPRTNDARHRCSGRTAMCREVLNDKWVSFPTWSEDSTFVTSRKTQYEEYIYRCEDERFELDVVIESNASTIRALEGVQKRMSRMGADEAARYRLDDCLGGTSLTIHQRALRRIYGDKVATDIIAGLKKNPVVAVPVVLRRLKAKEEEWREAQKGFNKTWREQNEKFYLKSLDHQGINFKQNDLKALRSKSLYNDIESVYEERRAAVRSGALVGAAAVGPHLTVGYGLSGDKGEGAKVLKDAAELLIHHVRRQTAIQKAEKRRIKQLLRNFVPDLFNHPRQPPSDDENDDDKDELCGGGSSSPGSANTDELPKREKREGSSGDSDANLSEKEGRSLRNKENHISNKNNNTTVDSNLVKVEVSSVKNGAMSDKSAAMLDMDMEIDTDVIRRDRDRVSADVDMAHDTDHQSDNDHKTDLTVSRVSDTTTADSRSVGPGVFVCTSPWYLFLRLHGVLCARLAAARRAARALAAEEERDARTRRPSTAIALRLKPGNAVPVSQYYSSVLELVRGALDGNLDAAAYEDGLREMLGIRAYPAYTLDKIVSYAVRQLQHCVSERRSVRCAEAAAGERARALSAMSGVGGSARRAREAQHTAAYRRRAERALRDEHAAFLVHVHGGDECRVEFELLEGAEAVPGSPDNTQSDMQEGRARLAAWSRYTEQFAHPTHAHAQHGDAQWSGGRKMFLTRTLRQLGGAGAVSSACAALRACHVAVTPDTPVTPAATPACHARRKPLHRDDAACCLRAASYRMRHVQRSTFLFSRRAQINTKKGAARARSRMLSHFRRWERAWVERHVAPNSRDRPLRHCPGFSSSGASSEVADR